MNTTNELDDTLSGDGGPRSAAAELGTGDVLADRYELRGILGQGGFGMVFRAHDRVAATEVAIKVLVHAPHREPVSAEQIRRELRAAWRVTHPGVVRIHDVFSSGKRIALSMELVDGETLSAHLARVGRLDPHALRELAGDLAAALAAAHAAGVIHGDLKPSNILLRAGTKRAVITDFGLSRIVSGSDGASERDLAIDTSELSRDRGTAGTPAFMAPEQLRNAPDIGPPADVYALGLILYEAATGKRPHPQRTWPELMRARLERPAPRVGEARSRLPARVRQVIDACLVVDVDRRPADGAAVVAKLARPSAGRWIALAVAGVALGATAIGLASLRHRAPAGPALEWIQPASGPVHFVATVPGTIGAIVQRSLRDPSGNLVIAGHSTMPFGVGAVDLDLHSGLRQGFLLSLSPTGSLRWHRELGEKYDQQLVDIAISDGLVVGVGSHHGPSRLGDGVDVAAPEHPGIADCYIAAYDVATGKPRWAHTCGASGFGQLRSVVADGNGNFYVSGDFAGTLAIGGQSPGSTTKSIRAVFVASYRADGTLRWVTASDDASDSAHGMALAVRGDQVLFAGQVVGRLRLHGGTELVGDSDGDAFLVALDAATGAVRSSYVLAGTGSEIIDTLAVAPSGRVVIGGGFTRSYELVAGQPIVSDGAAAPFVAMLDLDSNRELHALWSRAGRTANFSGLRTLAVDSRGIVAVGRFDVDLAVGDRTLTSKGSNDVFMLGLDMDGTVTALESIGGPDSDRPRSVDLEPGGDIRLTGTFRSQLDIRGLTVHGQSVTSGFVVGLRR